MFPELEKISPQICFLILNYLIIIINLSIMCEILSSAEEVIPNKSIDVLFK